MNITENSNDITCEGKTRGRVNNISESEPDQLHASQRKERIKSFI